MCEQWGRPGGEGSSELKEEAQAVEEKLKTGQMRRQAHLWAGMNLAALGGGGWDRGDPIDRSVEEAN